MRTHLRAAAAALASLALAGCAGMPYPRAMSRDVATAVQPLEVRIAIAQHELFPTYPIANTHNSACTATPGVGLLLAVACSAATAAADSAINARRATEAAEIFAPLKAELADLKFDPALRNAMAQALGDAPGVAYTRLSVTKEVRSEDHEAWFRASTANAVLVLPVSYYLAPDFTSLVISARPMLFPRSPSARTAAGQPPEMPAPPDDTALLMKNAVYRRNIFYVARLPVEAANREAAILAWKADGARLLRAGLQDGVTQMSRLVTQDLQRTQGADVVAVSQVTGDAGSKVDLLEESHGGRLLRYPNGNLQFVTTLAATAPARL